MVALLRRQPLVAVFAIPASVIVAATRGMLGYSPSEAVTETAQAYSAP